MQRYSVDFSPSNSGPTEILDRKLVIGRMGIVTGATDKNGKFLSA